MDALSRLSRLDTLWSVVHRAHADDEREASRARQELIQRYTGAVRRYLLGALRDEHAADEVFQEFALRLARGDFHRASPELGRFRMFVKTALFRMIVDYQRAKGRSAKVGLGGVPELAAPSSEDFTRSWRIEMLDRAFTALKESDSKRQSDFFSILKARIDHPQLRSPEIAALLSQELNKSITAANFRTLLRRARRRFAELLLEEVCQTIAVPSPEELESELAELNLLEYCKPILADMDD